jgi:hypothetical protein
MQPILGRLGICVGDCNAFNRIDAAPVEKRDVIDSILSNLLVENQLVGSGNGKVCLHRHEVDIPVGEKLRMSGRRGAEESGGKEEGLDKRHGVVWRKLEVGLAIQWRRCCVDAGCGLEIMTT